MDCSGSSLSSPSPPPSSNMTDTTMVDSDHSSSQSRDKLTHGGHDSSQGPVLGQPRGFSWGPDQGPMGSSPYFSPHPSQQHPSTAPHVPLDNEPPPPGSKKRSSKGKEKEKDPSKGRSRSNKEKTTKRTSPPQAVAQADSASGESQGSTHTTSSFRIKGYVNDPSQGPVPMAPTSYFPRQRPRAYSPVASEAPSEHVEHQGHDRPREKKSSRRPRKEHHHPEHPPLPPPPQPLPPHPAYPYYPPHYAYPPYAYAAPPTGAHSSQETYYPQSQPSRPRYSPMSQESSHSRHSGPSVASSDDPKKPRVITLLIDDLRSNESELAEVRVPLKPTPGGYWADAKEVSKALQASASKLDGPARVYAMRGKYKQVFLRVAADGEETFNSANLKIGDDRTIEVFVEYIAPFARHHPGLMTPRSESITSGSLKRRRSFDTTAEEAYPDPEPPTPSHASTDMHPERSPSVGPSRGSSPMAVEDSYPDPFTPHSQETQQSGPTVETRSGSDGSRNSAMSLSGSEPSNQEPAPRGLPVSQSQIDTAPPPFGTPPVSASVPKPTPKPRPPPPPSTLPVLQTTPTQLPPAKKARHDDSANSDSEEMDHPRAHSQPSLAPARGFGGFRAPSGPSAFSTSAFGSYATAGSSFTAKPGAALASQAAGLRRGSAAKSPLDVAVGNHLKSVLSKEADFRQFQEARNRTLTVAEQVEQYRYLQRKLDEHVGRDIPVEVDLAPGIVTKEQVMCAFGLPANKADECREVLDLTDKYGPRGRLTQDAEAEKLFYEPPPISTNIQIGRYLDVLRGVHSRWTTEHS